MDLNKTNQILRVAKMYYEENMAQQDIANIEEISVATVSRLLKKAEELGFIKISIVQPFYSTADLEVKLKGKYGLKKVNVIPDLINNHEALVRDLNKSLLEDLNKIVKDKSTVGIAWGNTMTSLAKDASALKPFEKKDVDIVQLYGGISPLLNHSGSIEIIQSLAKLLNAEAYQICAPAYVDNQEMADLFKKESQIASILDKGKKCDVAIFSAGSLEKDGFVFNLGSLNENTRDELIENEAVGDICLHFLKEDGSLAIPELDKRCITLSLDEIKEIPEKLLIAYDSKKAPIVKTALESHLVDRLYVDEELAKALLK